MPSSNHPTITPIHTPGNLQSFSSRCVVNIARSFCVFATIIVTDSSLMLLLLLLGIAVLLSFVGLVHLSVKGKLISSTLLLKNVSGPYPKKSSTTSVTLAFPHLFAPRFSKLCLTPTSSNISNLTTFFQITSMASVRQDLQGIFSPVLLMSGHPLLRTSENHSLSLLISLRHLTRVWHKALLAKLPAYGFTLSFCKLISSFLSNRFISVVVDGATSASFPVSSGVPQGSVLSPTLFLLFINDLLHATDSDVHSFADDSNLHKFSSFQCQPSSNARSQSRLAMSSTVYSDLQSISEWGTRNLVKFNTSKTQLLTISLSNTPSNYPIIFEGSEIPSLNSVNILGLQISSSLSWRDHIVQIAKSASKKLGVLFRCKQYFNSAQLFKLYTGFIRPCLEYCSHIWGSSPYTSLLDRIESKAIRLIGDPSLTSTLDPLSLRRKVASLSLFYRYYFGHCSDELATCIPPPMARPRSTRQATFAHNYCVELSNARINRLELIGSLMLSSLLLPTFGTLSLPLYFQLPSTFLPSKGRPITTLGARWHDFFFLFHFLDVFY